MRSGCGRVLAGVVLLGSAAAVGLPVLIGAGTDTARAPSVAAVAREVGASVVPWIQSAAWAGGIAFFATLVGAPIGVRARDWPARRVAAVMLVLVMPSYLMYAGWGELRAPDTWIGDWIATAPRVAGVSASVVAGRVIAVAGLGLWAWPIAMLVVWAGARRVHESVWDRTAMEARGLARARVIVGLVRGPIVRAWCIVGAIMVGSAVPMHLAQIPTASIKVWTALDESAVDERWRVWALGLGPILVACLCGLAAGRRLGTASGDAPGVGPSSARRGWWVVALAVALVLMPMGLLARTLPAWTSVVTTWRLHAGAAGTSVVTGICVGSWGLAVAGAAWYALATGGRLGGSSRWALGLLVALGLAPGVLVGSAILRFAGLLGIDGSPAMLVLGHGSRVLWVAALGGVALARAEADDIRSLRLLEAGTSLIGWARTIGPAGWGALGGVGVAVMGLSLGEIEASIMLQPPGVQSFARDVLQLLHYNRYNDLASIVVGLGAGLAVTCGVAAVLTRIGTTGRTKPTGQG